MDPNALNDNKSGNRLFQLYSQQQKKQQQQQKQRQTQRQNQRRQTQRRRPEDAERAAASGNRLAQRGASSSSSSSSSSANPSSFPPVDTPLRFFRLADEVVVNNDDAVGVGVAGPAFPSRQKRRNGHARAAREAFEVAQQWLAAVQSRMAATWEDVQVVQKPQRLATVLRGVEPALKSGTVFKLRQAAVRVFVELLKREPVYALRVARVEHHLWMLFYCEIEPLQRLFHSSGGPLQQNKDMRAFARRTLYNVLKFTGKVLQDAVSVLKRGASSNDAAAVEARRVSMSRLLTSLGDLQRYQQVYCSPNSKNWEPAQRLYQQALKLFPGSGKAHNQLALLAAKGDDARRPKLFLAAFHYFFSLSVSSPFPARQNMLSLFAKTRTLAASLLDSRQPKRTADDPKKHFLLLFLRVIGILVTGIGAETLADLIPVVAQFFMATVRSSDAKTALGARDIVRVIMISICTIVNTLCPLGGSSSKNESNSSEKAVGGLLPAIPPVLPELTRLGLSMLVTLLADLCNHASNEWNRIAPVVLSIHKSKPAKLSGGGSRPAGDKDAVWPGIFIGIAWLEGVSERLLPVAWPIFQAAKLPAAMSRVLNIAINEVRRRLLKIDRSCFLTPESNAKYTTVVLDELALLSGWNLLPKRYRTSTGRTTGGAKTAQIIDPQSMSIVDVTRHGALASKHELQDVQKSRLLRFAHILECGLGLADGEGSLRQEGIGGNEGRLTYFSVQGQGPALQTVFLQQVFAKTDPPPAAAFPKLTFASIPFYNGSSHTDCDANPPALPLKSGSSDSQSAHLRNGSCVEMPVNADDPNRTIGPHAAEKSLNAQLPPDLQSSTSDGLDDASAMDSVIAGILGGQWANGEELFAAGSTTQPEPGITRTTSSDGDMGLGDQLFLRIQAILSIQADNAEKQPVIAGKITGMILEALSPSDVVNLLNSEETLRDAMTQAQRALESAATGESSASGSGERRDDRDTAHSDTTVTNTAAAVETRQQLVLPGANGVLGLKKDALRQATAAAAHSAAAVAEPTHREGSVSQSHTPREYENETLVGRRGNESRTLQTRSQRAIIHSNSASRLRPLVVLDAPNICMRHGMNQHFSCRGIELALGYWERRGHRAVGFMPDYYLDMNYIGGKRRMKKANMEVRKAVIPDDIRLLQRLVQEKRLMLTPAQDYDDSYTIEYAKRNPGAIIVTNDLFRDHVDKHKGNRRELRAWLKSHCMSFTFVFDDFIPNPDFVFPNE